jgi:hypothetical protein
MTELLLLTFQMEVHNKQQRLLPLISQTTYMWYSAQPYETNTRPGAGTYN